MEAQTSHNEPLKRPADEPLETQLAGIVGDRHVMGKPDEIAAYFAEPVDAAELLAVQPATHEEVQEVVALANDLDLPVYTLYTRHLQPADVDGQGIILDFCRMTAIEKLDGRNLLANVQRGLTFDALKKELDALDLKIATPLAATSDSVLCNFLSRAPLKKATLYPEVHLYNLRVVHPDGSLFPTGSHSLNERVDCPNEGGPNLGRWNVASDDIFGVVTRGTIWLYPKTECRDALLFGFDRLEDVVTALRNAPRTELGWEYLAANRRFLASLLQDDVAGLPPWTLIVGFDGLEKLVAYQKKRVLEIMSEMGARPVESLRERITELLDEVWYQASPLHTGFYADCRKIKELDDIAQAHITEAGFSSEEIGQCLLSVNRGRCLYSQYDIFAEAGEHKGLAEDLASKLAARGAFYDRPEGKLADEVIGRVPNLRGHLRTIKDIVDPKGILNPGRYVSMEDPRYDPPTVEIETDEDTGIESDNIRTVEEKLVEALGREWVTSNPADLAAYGRDFTIYAGERPNLVVLPQSTEEVQKVMRIAYRHKIPVVPLSTGFNHGGLAIPRKGGILVDLKRLDRLLEIDEETLTATFEPGVRMRNLYQECQKVTTFKGLKLKPSLPLTLASISLLSNYVSRGGPGNAVKYGFGMDLTVNMTWVLPNGEILRTGPASVPEVGNLGLNWGPGPDISGMFFNADGAMGICTQITVKLFPDMHCEEMVQAAIFDPDPLGCEKACEAIYALSRDNLIEFIYKSHPGVSCVSIAGLFGGKPQDYLFMTPSHPLMILVTGFDEEDLNVRLELVREIFARIDLLEFDRNILPPEMAEMITTLPMKASVGVDGNTVGAYRGAFQWQAGYIQVEDIPKINQEYKKLIKKYWKSSDVKVSMEASLTGTDMQGPLPYCRLGTVEFDYWWDQGNPESVKRAGVMIRKTTELMFEYGCIPIRNMFGFGELLMPRLGVYYDLLKQVRKAFDPANLMHPDVLPATDDYV